MFVLFFFVQNAYKAFLGECFHNNVPTARRSFCKEEDEVWDQIKKSIFYEYPEFYFTKHQTLK